MSRTEGVPEAPEAAEEVWTRFDALVATGGMAPLSDDLEAARAHALSRDLPDDEIARHGEERVDEAVQLATFLASAVEVRTPIWIQVERVVRFVLLALTLYVVVSAVKEAMPKPPNVAQAANVTLSSRRAGSGPPGDLTNGKVAPETGIATNDEADPWAEIDLGRSMRIAEVTLMVGDEHKDDVAPLRIDTSVDEKAWVYAGMQRSGFSAADPAVVTFGSRDARYVRIHGRPGGALYLHEVEIR